MHCVTDDGQVLAVCHVACPLRLRAEEQEREILRLLPKTYRELYSLIEMPEDLMSLLCHLQYYGCVTRDSSGSYLYLQPLPEFTECSFSLCDE